jgi:hypothetical protein
MDIATIQGALDLALNSKLGVLSDAYKQVALNFSYSKGDIVKARASIDASVAVLQNAAALIDNVLSAQAEIAALTTSGGTLTVSVPVAALPAQPVVP